jgi:hypothetical protein
MICYRVCHRFGEVCSLCAAEACQGEPPIPRHVDVPLVGLQVRVQVQVQWSMRGLLLHRVHFYRRNTRPLHARPALLLHLPCCRTGRGSFP